MYLNMSENNVETGVHKLSTAGLEKSHKHADYSFTTQSPLLTTLRKKPFENIMGKGANAGNQHLLLFPKCFLPIPLNASL